MTDAPVPVGSLLHGDGGQTWADYATERRYSWAADVLDRIEALVGPHAVDYASGWLADDGNGPQGNAVAFTGSAIIFASVKTGERAGGVRNVETTAFALPLSVVTEIRLVRANSVQVDLVQGDGGTVRLPLPPFSIEPADRLRVFLPSLVQRLGA